MDIKYWKSLPFYFVQGYFLNVQISISYISRIEIDSIQNSFALTKMLDEISNKRYMAVALLEDRLFFAGSQTGAEHDVRFEIRICVDDFIETMQFSNLRNSSDIRVALSCMDLTAHVHWHAAILDRIFGNAALDRSTSFAPSLRGNRLCKQNHLFCCSPRQLTAILPAQYFSCALTWLVDGHSDAL